MSNKKLSSFVPKYFLFTARDITRSNFKINKGFILNRDKMDWELDLKLPEEIKTRLRDDKSINNIDYKNSEYKF